MKRARSIEAYSIICMFNLAMMNYARIAMNGSVPYIGQSYSSLSSLHSQVDKVTQVCPLYTVKWTKSLKFVQSTPRSGQNHSSLSGLHSQVDKITQVCPVYTAKWTKLLKFVQSTRRSGQSYSNLSSLHGEVDKKLMWCPLSLAIY